LEGRLFILCEVKALDKKIENGIQAIIVLHEIYGINEFIQEQCQKYRVAGYDVFCPNLIDNPPFPYEKSEDAYDFFVKNIGFEVYKEINVFINELKEKYDNVFVIGFSVGATIAWRCCENSLCSGIISFYGSRIRDYTNLNPACPTLLLFAKEDSFDVHALVLQLQDKQHLSIIEFDAEHGFVDSFSKHFNLQQTKRAEKSIACFMNECTK
jgi:dienelactone hydrolase